MQKPTKNYTKLCKTKPISEKPKLTQMLFRKQLTKISTTFCHQKTKPIQSQTKPISKMTKINATCFIQRNYEKILAFFRQKNKANSKPISKTSKNNHKLFYNKGLWKCTLLQAKKKQSQSNPISGKPEINAGSVCARKRATEFYITFCRPHILRRT